MLFLDEALATENAALLPQRNSSCPVARAAALCHMARTVCRRAERAVVALSETETVSEHALQYLNRLSVAVCRARVLNRAAGHPEPQWRRDTFT